MSTTTFSTHSSPRIHPGPVAEARSSRRRARAGDRRARAMADERADEFAIISHELRNSLSVVRNAARLLRLPAGSVSGVEGARILIERHVGQMTQHIQDLLDLHAGPGRHQSASAFSRRSAHTHRILRQRDRSGPLRVADIPLDGLFARRGDCSCMPHPARLEQVFSNLLINTAKYTPDRGQFVVRRPARVRTPAFPSATPE